MWNISMKQGLFIKVKDYVIDLECLLFFVINLLDSYFIQILRAWKVS